MDAEKAHFVTQHRADLIQKVSTVMAIVESLGTFVHPEIYAEIHAERTSRGQMRILYLKLVDSGGPVVKAAFYEALKEHQPHLLEDHGPVPPSYADPVCPSQPSAPAADLHPESDDFLSIFGVTSCQVLLSGCLKVLQTTMEMYNVPNPGMPGCPPGLEYLTQVDQLLVKQKVEAIEALIGFESNNKYEVRNAMGQNVFYAVEENDCLSRQCCGPLRPFTIRVLDNFGQEVISVSRPLKCMGCCFPCCLQELEVQAPPGNTVGYVVQQWHPFSPKFIVEDEHREPILKIHGPFCGWSCLPDVDFEIMTLDEVTKIGKISKQWTGLLREVFTDADNFGIQFPMDLDVKMKATMIGACFLIDFMFFESNN